MESIRVKKILVPTDFSRCSMAATDRAVSLAQTFQAQVILLHVMEPPVYGLDFSLTHPGILPVVRQKLMERMEQAVDVMRDRGIEAEGYFIIGVPSVEIIRAAEKHNADLIVMGTHGRTGLSHILLGSTAERVIQRARCPVLTVKETQPPASIEKEGESGQQDQKAGHTAVGNNKTLCYLCARPSQDIICEACKIRVQAEAFEQKQKIEKEGRVETGRR
jgi:nucleotide-binding universal stress UspA family protein